MLTLWYKLGILLLCGGCSVQPLHELKTESQHQSTIFVNVIAGKHGQTLRGYIQDLLSNLDITDKRYVLTINLSEKYIPFALADDANAQKLKIYLSANILLQNENKEKVLETSVGLTSIRNISNSQAEILLYMFDKVADSTLKDLAFRIVENIKVALERENRI